MEKQETDAEKLEHKRIHQAIAELRVMVEKMNQDGCILRKWRGYKESEKA